jgi:hypothetical protein
VRDLPRPVQDHLVQVSGPSPLSWQEDLCARKLGPLNGKAFEQSFAIAALTTIGMPQVNLVHAN